jgi:hypothetical protein
VLEQLAREHADTGRAAQFAILDSAIGKWAREVSNADLAARMGTSEGAVKRAVWRLRKRFKTIQSDPLRAECRDARRFRQGRDQRQDPRAAQGARRLTSRLRFFKTLVGAARIL